MDSNSGIAKDSDKMSDAVLIALSSVFATIFSIVVSQVLASWINKRKENVEIRKLKSDTNLTEGDLVLKYQKIAMDQADENVNLAAKIKIQEAEKNELLISLQQLREDMLRLDQAHREEIARLKETFELERKENEKWKFWAKRLVAQLNSWDLSPVPFDLQEAKAKGLFLGDIGKGNIEDKKE
jgi:lipopolysaccharide export LptBFGC system permease protein LptF